MHNDDKIVSKLNELLEKNYDAEKGYKKAAEDIKNSQLQDFLQSHSQQRYDFGHELKGEIKKLGGEPEKGTSLTADLHRTWIDLRSAIAGNNDKAVIEECERGEKAALEDYQEVLASAELPESTRSIVKQQHDRIQDALYKIKDLEKVLDRD